jgi:hypothetical protein
VQYNAVFDTVISCDTAGLLEYWRGSEGGYAAPSCVQFSSKLDTDLSEFVKIKRPPHAFRVAPF